MSVQKPEVQQLVLRCNRKKAAASSSGSDEAFSKHVSWPQAWQMSAVVYAGRMTTTEPTVTKDYIVKPLDPDTWEAFARLAERHNGVFGGCWCTWFQTLHSEKTYTAEGNRALKQRLVNEGRAHAALVFDGDEAVAWCEYGTPEELPNMYHRKEYEANLDTLPDYRITCLFVDKKYRRQGLTAVALRGALELIAQAGGGVVEGYPHDTGGQKVSVLYNGTRSLFEQDGFSYVRPKGTRNCVMRTTVTPAA
jgi:GNAT superfamily N-acetyltransferase